MAAEGVSQLATAEEKPVVARLRTVWTDKTAHAEMREAAMRALAKLGDSGPLNEVVSNHRKAMDKAREETPPNYNIILPTCRALGYLYLTVNQPDNALRYYTAYANVLFGFPYPAKNPALMTLSANVFYNMACAASNLKSHYLSLWALNQHFNYG